MGRSRYKIFDTAYPYFVTMTTVEWVPLFSNPAVAEIVLESLRYNQEHKHLVVYAYVLMEHHLHAVLSSDELGQTLQLFKSYTARSIIDYYEAQHNTAMLEKLRQSKLRHKTESDYQVWQEGTHPEEIQTEEMMRQKIEYIHQNPVRRGYVDEPEQWRYSSARNYEGQKGLVDVETNW
jgi:putative transposase